MNVRLPEEVIQRLVEQREQLAIEVWMLQGKMAGIDAVVSNN